MGNDVTWTESELDDGGNPGGVCGDSGDRIGEPGGARGGVAAFDLEILAFDFLTSLMIDSVSFSLLFLSPFRFEF